MIVRNKPWLAMAAVAALSLGAVAEGQEGAVNPDTGERVE